MIKIYSYKNCSTCKKSLKFLDENNISYECIEIRQNPPSLDELNHMLTKYGDLKFLFNTSGVDYRELNLKEKRKSMSNDEQLALLSTNGNLIKRPFIISNGIQFAGFKQPEWEEAFKTKKRVL